MHQLLIVEDDAVLQKMLCYHLREAGYGVTAAGSAGDARQALARQPFAAALLDVALPDGDGLALAETLKHRQPQTLIIFLTANDEEGAQLAGYGAGAIDYITKPFSVAVLVRKLAALLALPVRQAAEADFDDGHLRLSFSQAQATLDGEAVALSAMEWKMLALFCAHPRQVLSRARLLERLWDESGAFVEAHTLTTTVSRLRGKIEAGGRVYIKTVYGLGYVWTGGEG